jgi:hypothetical protein
MVVNVDTQRFTRLHGTTYGSSKFFSSWYVTFHLFPYLVNNKTFYFALYNLPFTAEIDKNRSMKVHFFFGMTG